MKYVAIFIIIVVMVVVIAALAQFFSKAGRRWRSRHSLYEVEERKEFNQLVVGASQSGLNFIPVDTVKFRSTSFEQDLHEARAMAETHCAALNQNKRKRLLG